MQAKGFFPVPICSSWANNFPSSLGADCWPAGANGRNANWSRRSVILGHFSLPFASLILSALTS